MIINIDYNSRDVAKHGLGGAKPPPQTKFIAPPKRNEAH